MNLFKFFRATKTYEEDIQREIDCMARIKDAVSKKCGLSQFIVWDDFTVAFAGSKDNMELLLEISTQKCDGKKYLYASVDDEVSWQEWDFDSLDEFEDNIIEYIAHRVNRTIKNVIEVDKKSCRVASYYLSDHGDWICFEEHTSESKLFCWIVSKIKESSETIKTYRLE